MVVVSVVVLRERSPLHFHLVSGLPRARNHLAHPAHGLGVGEEIILESARSWRMSSAAIVSRRIRDPRTHVFGDFGIEMVAHHQHIEVLVERVHRIRPRRIGRRRQHIARRTL